MLRKYFLGFVALFLFSCISILGFSKNVQLSLNEGEGGGSIASNQSGAAAQKSPSFGILVPLEHAALKEIVDGFKSTVKKQYPKAVFNVQNAQGDIKLQRTIIEQFVGQKVDVIVPIGTTSTQMTLSYVKHQPIVSLAADYPESERLKRQPHNITGVLDEIGGVKKMQFIKQVYPNLKKLTIIYHSGNEKNFREIEDMIDYGKKHGITVQKLSIHTLPDLETTVQSMDKDSEAIVILKDHLIASGIRLLVPTAEEHGIPLISSDEGSVQEGASFALGVQEKTIGETGGKLAIQVIEGKPIEDMPMQAIQNLAVFYNQKAFNQHKQKLELNKIRDAAKEDGYTLIAK